MAINLKGYRITVLCEDVAQFDFLSCYAKTLGAENRKIFKLPAHNNASVLKHYPTAVKDYRRFASENIILLVMIDADEKTIQERLREFDEKLDSEKARLNQPTRLDNEKILLFVPIRNIESWFYYIETQAEHIETKADSSGKLISYKNQSINQDISKLVNRLKNDICLNGLPDNAPSSLHHACNELKRLA